jgi:hypothetical protein
MLLITLEILVTIVAPLLVLYLTGPWSIRTAIPCLLAIPVIWYLTYSPIHELSHVLGAYLAGGSVTQLKLIPSFWHGEFGRAWITPQGLVTPGQRLVMTGAPYALDGLSVAVGFFALPGGHPRGPFTSGVAFMLLCLRPVFDAVCETVAFALGGRGDLHHIAQSTGDATLWLGMALLLGFSLLTIARVLVKTASARGGAVARRGRSR